MTDPHEREHRDTPAAAEHASAAVPSPPDVVRALEAALGAHDRIQAIAALLEAVDRGMTIEVLYDEVVTPFLASVGASWQRGSTQVWEEHLATQAVRTAIEALYPRVQDRRAAAVPIPLTVVFFCPPSEAHDLGLRMLADRFDMNGFRAVYVGAGTPTSQMVAAATAVAADIVCLTASTHFNRATLREAVTALEEALPHLRVLVGGAAFRDYPPDWADHFVGDIDAFITQTIEGVTGGDERHGRSG